MTACGNDESESDLFGIALRTDADANANIVMGYHSVEVTIDGCEKDIIVDVIGEFDYFKLSNDIPNWIIVTPTPDNTKQLTIKVKKFISEDARIARVEFMVFKGAQKQLGTIVIIQNPLTFEELKKIEQKAINAYISNFDVCKDLPSVNDIQIGSVAPFYKLNSGGNVYMQVIKMGTVPVNKNERIYFRFMRYNLLSYLENGVLPAGEGNAENMTASATFFELGSDNAASTQWGNAIQQPLLLGLPIDSEVNLVVSRRMVLLMRYPV